MKKWIALLLALTLCVSLCACGENDKYEEYEDLIEYLEDEDYEEAIEWIVELAMEEENGGFPGSDSDSAPTESPEDTALSEKYEELLHELENLDESIQEGWTYSIYYTPEGSEEGDWLYDSEAYLYLYEQLVAMGDYADCAQLAQRFTVLENKLLNITESYTDALGNYNEYTGENYSYDTEGVLVNGPAPAEYEELFWGTPNYEYDDSGKLICLRNVNHDGSIQAVMDITYNPDGTIASTDFKDASGTTEVRTYTYEEGKPVKCDVVRDNTIFNIQNYTYDDSGKLVKTEYENADLDRWRYVDTVVYTYDAAGRVASKRVSEFYYFDNVVENENYVNTFDYTYDDSGNILTVLETDLGHFDENGEQTSTNLDFPRTHTYNYGSYCIYTPAN